MKNNQAANKPVMGNTLDYYNDDMSRKAVGKLFDDLDDLDPDDDLQDTSNIVVGYDDNQPERKRAPEIPEHDPAMERALERAAELAGGKVERVDQEPESIAEATRPARSRVFEEDYDMGLYRRSHSILDDDEYEELMRPVKRQRDAERGGVDLRNPEPAVIRRTPPRDEPVQPRRRSIKPDSDEYGERPNARRERNDAPNQAPSGSKSAARTMRPYSPYLMLIFVVLLAAFALALFQVTALNGRLAEAEMKNDELSTVYDNYQSAMSSVRSLEGEIVRLEAEIVRLETIQEEAEPDSQSGTGAGSSAPALPALPTRYTVVAGDNLSKISNKFYGTPYEFERIKEANGKRNDTVMLGEELLIPAL